MKGDFIEGRDDRFVRSTKRKKSWDKELKDYSDYYFSGMKFKSKADLILRAVDMARSFIKSMNLPYDISVVFNRTDTSMTTGKIVIISTRMFDSPVLTDMQKIDLFISDIIHELSHVKHTNFKVAFPPEQLEKSLLNIIEDERIEMEEVLENPGYSNFIAAGKTHEHNERQDTINRALTTAKIDMKRDSALGEFVRLIYCAIRYPPGIDADVAAEFEEDLDRVKKLLTPYPKSTEESRVKAMEIGRYMRSRFRKIIEDALKEEKKKEKIKIRMDAATAKELMKGVKEDEEKSDDDVEYEIEITDPENYEEPDETSEDKESKSSGKGKKKSKKSEGDSEESPDDSPDSEESSEGSGSGDSDEEVEDESGDTDDRPGSGDREEEGEVPEHDGEKGSKDAEMDTPESAEGDKESEGTEVRHEGTPEHAEGHADEHSDEDGLVEETVAPYEVDKALEEELTLISSKIAKPVAESSEIRMAEAAKTEVPTSDSLRDAKMRLATSKYFSDADSIFEKRVFFIDMPVGKSTVYNEIRSKVTGMAGKVKAILKFRHRDEEICMKGMTSGTLDVNRLVEAVQGDTHVYETFGEIITEKGAVVLLIDESGSMAGGNDRIAMEAAIVLTEALNKNLDIELYIYGFSSDTTFSGSTEIYIYKEGSRYPRYGLTGVHGRNQNRDGDAILAVANRVKKKTKRPAIMFMISDGAPAAHGYGGTSGINHTKQAVKTVQKNGMPVIGVAIYDYNATTHIYDTVFVIKKVQDLPKELSKIAKDIISKLFKIKITEE